MLDSYVVVFLKCAGSAYRLAVVTLPGLVYVWSVKFEESLEAENSSKRRFIANVLCSIETSSNPTGSVFRPL